MTRDLRKVFREAFALPENERATLARVVGVQQAGSKCRKEIEDFAPVLLITTGEFADDKGMRQDLLAFERFGEQ